MLKYKENITQVHHILFYTFQYVNNYQYSLYSEFKSNTADFCINHWLIYPHQFTKLITKSILFVQISCTKFLRILRLMLKDENMNLLRLFRARKLIWEMDIFNNVGVFIDDSNNAWVQQWCCYLHNFIQKTKVGR